MKGRSRALAALLSVFVPGLGHLYLGRVRRGLAWAAAPVLVGVAVTFSGLEVGLAVLLVVLGATVVGWLGSVADAAIVRPDPARFVGPGRLALAGVALFLATRGNAVVLRRSLVEAFRIPAGSMMPTLMPGDHLFADKGVYKRRAPRRGEVMLFDYPEHPGQTFVKRVIGLGGDRIEVKEGRVFVNGEEIPRCAAGPWSYDDEGTRHTGALFVEFLEGSAYLVFLENERLAEYQGPFRVPDGEFFVLGDNRDNSHDSRMWFGGQGGSVPPDKVIGRGRVIWLSGAGETGRVGIDLAGPVHAPKGAEAGVAKCLAAPPISRVPR